MLCLHQVHLAGQPIVPVFVTATRSRIADVGCDVPLRYQDLLSDQGPCASTG
ncbi:MAG: hypothetical protein JWO88_2467 [Frankiales bacterium]|nr:hypothetical protein [Frankiales bacterium]